MTGRAVVLVCKTGGQTSGRADVREGKCPFTMHIIFRNLVYVETLCLLIV